MSAHVFQVGDRFLETAKYGEIWTGTITEIQPVGDETAYAYAWRDDDPEHSRGQRVVALTVDLTGSRYARVEHVELWDGGINGASTAADTYDCPEPGCDFNVSAVGTPDPDEPDEFTEDIEAHERSHQDAEPTSALTAEASIRDSGIEDDLDAPVPYIPTEPAPVPALVQLDQAEAHAESRLIRAALAWAASEHGIPWDHTDAQDELRAAAHDYRKVTSR